jgi:hypothetical protein
MHRSAIDEARAVKKRRSIREQRLLLIEFLIAPEGGDAEVDKIFLPLSERRGYI